MPQSTTRMASHLPALALAASGIALGAVLVHDAVDARWLTAESIFQSPLTVVGGARGAAMGAVLVWDWLTSRRP